jgi:hypothetical protein
MFDYGRCLAVGQGEKEEKGGKTSSSTTKLTKVHEVLTRINYYSSSSWFSVSFVVKPRWVNL